MSSAWRGRRRRRGAVPSRWALLLAAALVLSGAAGLAATSPQQIQFQGKLLDTSNNPRNGSFDLTFSIYNVPTGGTALWTETQAAVPVNNGVFSVALGAVNGLSTTLFGGASTFLGVAVSPDAEMTPRLPLLMAASAFRALVADDLRPGNTSYVQVSQTLQAGAAFNVASGTVSGPFQAMGTSTFTASGAQSYSLVASSGVLMQNGTMRLLGSGGLVADFTVQAATLSATTGLILPQGPAVIQKGALRFDATANLVYIGTGTANKTLADTDSVQTLTNKTLSSTGGNVVDATRLQTRALSAAAPSDGMVVRWDAAAGQWAPIYAATMTVFVTAYTPNTNASPGPADTVFLSPAQLGGTLSANQVRYRVTTAVAGVTGDVGLYDSGGNLVAHGGANSADFTVAGVHSVSLLGAPQTLLSGQYYFAMVYTGGTPSVRYSSLVSTSAGVVKGLGTFSLAAGAGTTLPANINLSSVVDGYIAPFMAANQ